MTEVYQLRPDEKFIQGGWEVVDGVTVEDCNAKMILYITNNLLNEIGRDSSGWRTLYQDKFDARYWELSYEDSDSHGGGAPLLRCISKFKAASDYGFEL